MIKILEPSSEIRIITSLDKTYRKNLPLIGIVDNVSVSRIRISVLSRTSILPV